MPRTWPRVWRREPNCSATETMAFGLDVLVAMLLFRGQVGLERREDFHTEET